MIDTQLDFYWNSNTRICYKYVSRVALTEKLEFLSQNHPRNISFNLKPYLKQMFVKINIEKIHFPKTYYPPSGHLGNPKIRVSGPK